MRWTKQFYNYPNWLSFTNICHSHDVTLRKSVIYVTHLQNGTNSIFMFYWVEQSISQQLAPSKLRLQMKQYLTYYSNSRPYITDSEQLTIYHYSCCCFNRNTAIHSSHCLKPTSNSISHSLNLDFELSHLSRELYANKHCHLKTVK